MNDPAIISSAVATLIVVAVALAMAAGFAWMWRTFHRRLDLLGRGRGPIRLWTLSLLGAMLGTLGTVGYLVNRG